VSRIAIFIDGAYLSYVLKDFGVPKVNFEALVKRITGSRELLRTYYYDCLPFQSQSPTRDESERFAKRQAFHAALTRIPRFQVRLGKLARRHENGIVRYEQKRVDILLAVDLVQLAAKRQITDAVLLAGDSDFLPAIEVAKAEGVVIHLYHGAAPHNDLRDCCDERTRVDQAFVDAIQQ
jgi:uncharacterized LabA/DUF88 family protein